MSHLTHMQSALGAGAIALIAFLLLILVALADGALAPDWKSRSNVWAWLGVLLSLVIAAFGIVGLIELVKALWELAGKMP